MNTFINKLKTKINCSARYSPTGSLLRGLRYLQSDNQMNNKNKVIDNILKMKTLSWPHYVSLNMNFNFTQSLGSIQYMNIYE